MSKKIFILLPDGVGLRNFAFTQFYNMGKEKGFDIVFWNNTIFDLRSVGINEIKISGSKLHPLTDVLKTAKIHLELNQFIRKTNDTIYDTYRFPFSNKSIKSKLKSFLIKLIIKLFDSEKGLNKIRNQIKRQERSTAYYKKSIQTLQRERASFVFCTNQRPVIAIAPLLAAHDLGIPTATFIFSWDNLPKATMVVETDYYFVWSNFMKKELLFYYPNIIENQIFITGTPQFEPHFDSSLLMKKESFFNKYNLDLNKKYICFSGDDITTSPYDETYLEDIAKAITLLNKKDFNLGVIFRRCPVDFSNRYDIVLKKYAEIIVPIDPLWKQNGETWNTVMPTTEDLSLQINIIANSEFVINIASSMVFDFVAFNKACMYINYNEKNKSLKDWNSKKVYNFVHFRSMPSKEAVIWLTNKDEIPSKIEKTLNNSETTIKKAEEWFKIINIENPEQASENIWNSILKILA